MTTSYKVFEKQKVKVEVLGSASDAVYALVEVGDSTGSSDIAAIKALVSGKDALGRTFVAIPYRSYRERTGTERPVESPVMFK